jgi:hypothetical protein
MQMNPYTISPIVDGQYHVIVYLDEWMLSDETLTFSDSYNKICQEDNEFRQVSFFDNHILKYRSESLFPQSDKIDTKKNKVMIILGNPAIHSVAKGMFFYSQGQKGHRHHFWGKLVKAGLIREELHENKDDREAEATAKKDAILKGDTSDQYTLGLTTFYSLPTPVKPRKEVMKKQYPAKTEYGDAAGVEKLFKAALPKLQKMEYDRLNSYDFAQGAIWIFTQLSSYRYVQNISRIEYWPMSSMSAGSGGEDLKKILRMP